MLLTDSANDMHFLDQKLVNLSKLPTDTMSLKKITKLVTNKFKYLQLVIFQLLQKFMHLTLNRVLSLSKISFASKNLEIYPEQKLFGQELNISFS